MVLAQADEEEEEEEPLQMNTGDVVENPAPVGDDAPDMEPPIPEGGEYYPDSPSADYGNDSGAGPDGAPSSMQENPAEPEVGEPYGDDEPNRGAPAPEDRYAYPDAGHPGDGEGAPPSAVEPYGEEDSYPSDGGDMPAPPEDEQDPGSSGYDEPGMDSPGSDDGQGFHDQPDFYEEPGVDNRQDGDDYEPGLNEDLPVDDNGDLDGKEPYESGKKNRRKPKKKVRSSKPDSEFWSLTCDDLYKLSRDTCKRTKDGLSMELCLKNAKRASQGCRSADADLYHFDYDEEACRVLPPKDVESCRKGRKAF